MQTLVTVIHIVTCILLVLVVLIQSGKGAEISTSLSGSSQTVFGSSGGANFFTRFTSVAAAVFMMTSLGLTLMGGQSKKSLFENMAGPSGQTVPAAAQSSTPNSQQGAAPNTKQDTMPSAKQDSAPSAPGTAPSSTR